MLQTKSLLFLGLLISGLAIVDPHHSALAVLAMVSLLFSASGRKGAFHFGPLLAGVGLSTGLGFGSRSGTADADALVLRCDGLYADKCNHGLIWDRCPDCNPRAIPLDQPLSSAWKKRGANAGNEEHTSDGPDLTDERS